MAEDQVGPSPAKKPKLTFTNHIEVLVGGAKHSFIVHKDVICARSPFFKAACSRRWATLPQKPVELPEDVAETFDIYLNCVYRNGVDADNIGYDSIGDSDESHRNRGIVTARLTATWILADKLGDVSTANMIIDEIIRFLKAHSEIPSAQLVAMVLPKLAEDSLMRTLFLDYYIHHANAACIRRVAESAKLPDTFLYDVIEEKVRLIEENRGKQISKVFPLNYVSRNKCRYHQHNDEHPGCARA